MRSTWKAPVINYSILKASKTNFFIRVWNRNTYILPEFVNKVFEIYNGNRFIRVKITEDMVGHKLGEFSPTRQICFHKQKK